MVTNACGTARDLNPSNEKRTREEWRLLDELDYLEGQHRVRDQCRRDGEYGRAAVLILHESGMSLEAIIGVLRGEGLFEEEPIDCESILRSEGFDPLTTTQGRAAEVIEKMKKS